MQCEYFALEGLSDLVNTIKQVHANLNRDLQVIGILRVMFDPRITLQSQVSEQLKAHFGDKVFDTVIPRNVRLAEAPSYGQPGVVFDPVVQGGDGLRRLRPGTDATRRQAVSEALGRTAVAHRGCRAERQRAAAAALGRRLDRALLARQGAARTLHQCGGRGARARCPKSWPRARRCTARPACALLFRITPFSQPPSLDDWLAQRGYQRFGDTHVMVCSQLPRQADVAAPAGLTRRSRYSQKRTLTSWVSSRHGAGRAAGACRTAAAQPRALPRPRAARGRRPGAGLRPVRDRGRSGGPVRRVHRAAVTRPGPVALAVRAAAGAGAGAGRAHRLPAGGRRQPARRVPSITAWASSTATTTTTARCPAPATERR